MDDIRPSENILLLSICALLHWFDRDVLRALTGANEVEIEALLISDLVTSDKSTGTYQLREDVRADALAQLRAERPSDESTWHRRIFEHFLQRMQESASDDRRTIAEDSVLYHLGELFLLIAARQEWHTLTELITIVRAIGPQQLRLQRWLSFYEAFVAIRTQDYDRGEVILTTLLSQIDVENKLRVQVLNALGQAHWFQARYDHALALYRRVLTLAQQTDDLFYQGIALANMGWTYEAIQQYDQALHLAIESLAIFRKLGDSHREGHALYDIGMYALRLGRWEVAQSHFQEAITLYEALHNQAVLAYLYWGRGLLFHLFGNETESETAYLRAQTTADTKADGQTALALDIFFQLGFLYQTQARWDAALAEYERAIELAHRLRNQYSATFIHYRRGNIFERQGRLDQAYAAYVQAIMGIEALRGASETEEIKIGLLGTAQQVYESMVLLCLALDRPAEAFHYVERARSRAFLDLLVQKQALADPALYDALAQPVATLAEVQSQLREDALLLEYFTIGVLPRGESLINQLPPENTRLREHLTLPPQTIIFAITRNQLEILRPRLDPNTLRPQLGDPDPSQRLLRDRLLTHMYAQLIAPAESLLRGRELLYLIPHGPLHYVPFMALRSADGAHLLDAAGPAIALAPSATVLLRNCLSRPPVKARHSLPLLALGYNGEGEDALRYAEAEADHVARLAGGQSWVGPAAKSQRLSAAVRQMPRLHIAGHAVYDPHDPLGSYIQLGNNDPLSARAIMRELVLEADLVTLSACMSGQSQVMSGDELMGLQRAFLYAGAPAVVCTLWQAADFVALLVMDRFYSALYAGSPPATALRDAQVGLRRMTGRDLLAALARWQAEDPAFVAALGQLPEVPPDALDAMIYADPFYWAPFMLIGRPD
jgi:CHAT domain-containing protein/predicted negative regulator of RcsB-dependent stress response